MLSIHNLHKKYLSKEGLTHHALRGINLELGSKGFIVLLGKSGSGKSTLLNILGGLDNFDSGEIIIKDKSTADFKANEWDSYRNTYVGFVFQEFYIIEEYSVGKNIALALELQGYPKERINERVADILTQVDLEGYQNRRPNEISGGQKQRIAIARALVKDPQIILADEPTGNLDSETGKLILETLKKLSQEKLVIMVTHDAEFAREYGDRIIELKDGLIISDQINYNQSVVQEKVYEVNEQIKSVIKLPKGKQLTQKMINYLNDCLLHDEKDLYLSITNKKESITKIVPELQQDIEHPVHYDVLSHLKDDHYDPFALKKTALPFKHALKLAVSSLLTRKIRLILTTFLFVISLVLVGIASNFTFFDINHATLLTFEQAGIDTVPIIKMEQECYDTDKYCYKRETSTKADDLNYFINSYPTLSFSTSVKFNINLMELVHYTKTSTSNYYSENFTRLTFVDNYDHYTILHGNDVVNDTDILITDYMSEMLVTYKAYEGVDSIDDLVGKTFNYRNHLLTIKGIVDTNYEKYENLKDNLDPYMEYDFSFNHNREYFYQQLFIKESAYDTVFRDAESAVVEMNFNHGARAVRVYKSQSIYQDKLVSGTLPQQNDEIVPTISFLAYHLNLLTEGDLLPENKASLQERLNSLIDTEVELTLVQKTDKLEEMNLKTYKIVGIVDDYGYIKQNDKIFIESDSLISTQQELKSLIENSNWYINSDFQYINAHLGDNNRENEQFIKDLKSSDYQQTTELDSLLFYVDNITSGGKNIMYAIGGFFAFLTAFMIFLFISSSIVAKKKEIGTLRAIGARGKDVSKIFLTEGLMIALASGIISLVSIGLIVRSINRSITNNFNVPLVLLYINLTTITVVFGLAVIVVLIATYLPLKRISTMKPIKAIKNN